MIGWLLVLSFLAGFVLTWVYVVRSVSRTLAPVREVSRRRVPAHAGAPVRERHRGDEVGADDEDAPPRRGPAGGAHAVPQVVEFEEDDDLRAP